MSTKAEIDELFKQAQDAINEGKSKQVVGSKLWPRIRVAIIENTELTTEKRRRLMMLIPEHLDKQSSVIGEKSQPLSIDDLLERPRSSEEAPRWHLW